MKKILTMLLIFVLAFGFAGCGNNGDDDGEGAGGNDPVIENNEGDEIGEDEENLSGEEGSGSVEPGQQLNPDDLYMSNEKDDYSSMEGEFDFGFETAKSFGLKSTVEKTDYSDISALASVMEERLKSAAESVFNTSVTVFGDYEEIEEDVIDKLAYAIGMEDDDTEKRFMEAGAYHNQSDEKHYQYVMIATENFYEVNEANIASALKTLEDGMGITISKKTLTKAANQAFEIATKTEDYYSLIDTKTVKGDGYQEHVKVSVDAFATEENEIGFYVSCERERCYE